MATPLQKNTCPGVHEIFVDPFLVIISIHLVCMNHMHRSRENIFFQEMHQFFTPKSPPIGAMIRKFTIFVALPHRCYMPNLVNSGPVVLEKMLTYDGRHH